MLKLRSRLFFIYSLFICAALGVLTIVINKNAHAVFSKMVTENIELRSKEIAASVSGFYDVFSGSFDVKRIEDAGMYFTHSGYIITLRDTGENIIWDARTCDMQECNKIINEIAQRMKNDHNLSGAMHIENFPIMSFGNTVGTVSVETYGPYFYSETDERFLSSLNRALFICALFMLFICAILSAFLAGAIS
ncbi:hypothetical protein FACS1894102_4960 [Spirochaetia bacterium]|nr:hypothetical protein FACS1894102_4960 [Spirochaetia bacterium]